MKDENENNGLNTGHGKFGLPEGYFQESANSIFNKIEWQEEHKNFHQLTVLKSTHGFIVPEGYFIKKEQKLELIQYAVLGCIPKEQIFITPDNYFEDLEIKELEKVLRNDENELIQFDKLNKLKRQNNFAVSENYFLQNEKNINQILGAKETKVISIFSKRIRYSIAAMLMIAFGVWIYNFYFKPAPIVDCGTIACLDKQDLVKTKNLESFEDEELYELVDPSALEKKLDKSGKEKFKTNNKDSNLNDISAEELLDNI